MSVETPFRWTEYVQLRTRYTRSVHLARDAGHASALDGYLLTPLVCDAAARIGRGLQNGNTARAWSITGPYGSGKSAFVLFLADLLAAPSGPATVKARKLLHERDPALYEALFAKGGALGRRPGLCSVVASGERRGLDHTLLDALYAGAQRFWSGPGKKPAILDELGSALRRLSAGRRIETKRVVELFEETAARVASSGNSGRGLFVVLDEGGRALEYAAHNPDSSDIMLLQELAEAASRSGDSPIIFTVVLHQAFESYASKLSAAQRNEWMKVQGRFEDIPFQESLDEILLLIGDALGRKELPSAVETAARKAAADAVQTLSAPASSRDKLRDALERTFPLNPITALALPPLFKSRLAQNERSLFAFLSSSEPHGFQEFLEQSGENAESYGLDRLYDYVVGSVGSRLFGALGRYWLEVDAALRRLPENAEPLDVRVLKAIGVLGALGEASGLVASERVLGLAFGDLAPISRSKLKASLERLSAASLIVFRKFKGAYQIWEGSDLDLEQLTHRAMDQLGTAATVGDRLGRLFPPRPVVARRHLFETGTLRYFEVRYANESVVSAGLRNATTSADGIVWIIIAQNSHAARDTVREVAQPMCWMGTLPVIVGVVRSPERLTQLAREAAALERVRAETPQLEADPVARRELALRLSEVEQLLRFEVAQLTLSGDACAWFSDGREETIAGGRGLTALVSTACDKAFHLAPAIHNELLNRAELSSAAAAARRNLMEAMITKEREEALGFSGAPPELAMYRSLLVRHRLHRKSKGAWAFAPPEPGEPGSLRPAYDSIKAALERHADARLPVTRVYEELRAPPYGVRDGVIPILLLAVMLERQPEIALYESGAFQPALTGPLIERLLRRPEQFEIQLYRVTGARSGVLHAFSEVGGDEALGPVELVRRWVRTVRDLNEFARATRSLSERAQAVRDILMRGKEPGPLVFRDLPVACGLDPIEPRGGAAAAGPVKEFAARMRAALDELERSYPRLLDRIEETVLTAFGLEAGVPSAARLELAARSSVLIPSAGDQQLRGILVRLADGELPREQWLVSVATLVCGRPPDAWTDRDLEQMRSSLTLLGRRFATLEALVLDGGGGVAPSGVTLLRVAVSEPRVAERERVVAVRDGDAELVARLCNRLREVVDGAAGDLSRDAIVAGLAMVTRDLLVSLDAEAHDHPVAPERR